MWCHRFELGGDQAQRRPRHTLCDWAGRRGDGQSKNAQMNQCLQRAEDEHSLSISERKDL